MFAIIIFLILTVKDALLIPVDSTDWKTKYYEADSKFKACDETWKLIRPKGLQDDSSTNNDG